MWRELPLRGRPLNISPGPSTSQGQSSPEGPASKLAITRGSSDVPTDLFKPMPSGSTDPPPPGPKPSLSYQKPSSPDPILIPGQHLLQRGQAALMSFEGYPILETDVPPMTSSPSTSRTPPSSHGSLTL